MAAYCRRKVHSCWKLRVISSTILFQNFSYMERLGDSNKRQTNSRRFCGVLLVGALDLNRKDKNAVKLSVVMKDN
jgi:hypothetical protein